MTYTKGNIIVENIKIGDIHYEFEYGYCIKSTVISLPKCTQNPDGSKYWEWESKHELSDRVIKYGVTENLSHYGPNLYDYEAYKGCKFV